MGVSTPRAPPADSDRMGDQHEHSAQINSEARLRNHSINWNTFESKGLNSNVQSLLDRFSGDYKNYRTADGDVKWHQMLDSDENAAGIAQGLMLCLSSSSISLNDTAHIVL